MPPEISIIVCSRKPEPDSLHERNVCKTIGTVSYEYLAVDNSSNKFSLAAAYNEGVGRSSGAILVFMHEDVFFMEGDWGGKLVSKFTIPEIGCIGVAGTEYLFADNPGWVIAGRPFIHGHVIHELDDGTKYHLTVFSWDKRDTEVVAVDGLFMAIRASLFTTIAFDSATFDGFHLYDLDICMQIRKTHRIIVTWDLLLKHQSGGSFDAAWQKYAARFLEKYRDKLPASCAAAIPDRSNRIGFENHDLKGKAPQITIA